MSETNVAQARPNLSALDLDTRINIAVAETQGATWRFDGKPLNGGWPGGWFFSTPEDPNAAWLSRHGRFGGSVPQYTRDPAAWGALMEKELSGVRQAGRNAAPWLGQWWQDDIKGGAIERRGPNAPTPGVSVALAVLAKYGVEVPS